MDRYFKSYSQQKDRAQLVMEKFLQTSAERTDQSFNYFSEIDQSNMSQVFF